MIKDSIKNNISNIYITMIWYSTTVLNFYKPNVLKFLKFAIKFKIKCFKNKSF